MHVIDGNSSKVELRMMRRHGNLRKVELTTRLICIICFVTDNPFLLFSPLKSVVVPFPHHYYSSPSIVTSASGGQEMGVWGGSVPTLVTLVPVVLVE